MNVFVVSCICVSVDRSRNRVRFPNVITHISWISNAECCSPIYSQKSTAHHTHIKKKKPNKIGGSPSIIFRIDLFILDFIRFE